MNHHHTAKATSWILLFAVLVLLVPFSFVHASVEELLFTFVQTVFGWLVGVGAVVLNYAINTWVIEFGETFGGGIGTQIESTWVIFRDIFNLTFIFGLVYIGFKMILRTDDGQTKRWLVQLIIAALLVNFSLFITKFVIDFSNIIAVEIMNQRVGLFPLNGSTVGRPNDIDLSFTMQDSLNLVTVNDSDVGDDYDGGGYTFIFAMMFLYIVTAFVYFAAGILLVIRGVVLLVLMILSPFLFLGMVLPMFASFSRNLWHTLFKRAFMAPIYIALLYISLEIARGITPGNFSEALRPDSGSSALTIENTAAAFGPFIVIIVLLLMSLIAAQKLGAEGASTAIRVGQNLRQRGQRMVGAGSFGMAARIGRSTAGAGADALSRNQRFRNLAATSKVGSYAMRGAKKVADSSFDARNVAGLGNATGLGSGKKGGFATRQKEDERQKAEMLKWIGSRDMNKEENKNEARARAQEIREEASGQEAQLKQQKELYESYKDKEPAEVAKEIGELDAAILQLTQQLQDNQNEMSQAEKDDFQAEINTKQTQRENLVGVQSVVQERADIKGQVESNLERASQSVSDPVAQAKYIESAQALERQLNQQSANFDQGIRDAQDRYHTADETAVSEVKYKDRTDYMERLEKDEGKKRNIANALNPIEIAKSIQTRFKTNPQSSAAGLAAYPTGTAIGASPLLGVGGAAGFAGVGLAGAVTGAAAHKDSLSIKNLKKEFGANAKEMAMKDKERDSKANIKTLMEEIQSVNPTDVKTNNQT